MQISDPLGQVIAPVVGACIVTFLMWRLNRILSRGRPMSPVAKKLLSHGFVFMLGIGLFIGWNDELAIFLRFPGREVWQPLAVGWALFLFYDAGIRLKRERRAVQAARSDAAFEQKDTSNKQNRNSQWTVIITILRLLLFFAIIGAIGRPSLGAFCVVGTLLVAVILVSRRERKSSSAPGTFRQ